LDEAGFTVTLPRDGGEGAQNDVRWRPDHPPLNVILRCPIAKSVQRAQNS